jgi:hypothetical protein
VDELHASIAAYLRAQRRQPAETGERESAILGIWRERCAVPCCRYCGKPITAGDDAFDVEQMRAARACVDHYAPF